MLTGPDFYFHFVPQTPPGDLTKAEYLWYLKSIEQGSNPYQQSTIVELMMVYEMIEKNENQGLVMRQWIKESYAKSLKANPPCAQNAITPYQQLQTTQRALVQEQNERCETAPEKLPFLKSYQGK